MGQARAIDACRAAPAAVLLLSCLAWPVHAAEDPRELMRASDKQHRIARERTRAKMVLQESGGPARVREVESITVQDEAKGDRAKIIFHAPADVSGTTLLTIENPNGADEQWLYLPAFRKSRRVGEAELGDRFVGTDFFYEDLKRRHVDDYSYKLLGDEAVDGQACHVIEATPSAPEVVKESPYGKSQLWLRKDNLVVVRIRFFDRRMKPLKMLEAKKLRQVQGKAWRADEIEIVDLQRKHRTVLTVEQRETPAAVSAETFSQHMLGR